MRRSLSGCLLVLTMVTSASAQRGRAMRSAKPQYTVAFASFAPLNTDLFIADGDGSNPKALLPDSAADYDASFSNDGRWVVFTSERGGSPDVYRVHPDGSGLEQLTNHPGFDDQGALSPDGRSLAFVSTRAGQADIWILQLATGALTNLTNSPAGDFRPSWSPDGKWIAFSSDRDSKRPKFSFVTVHSTELYVTKPDGSGQKRVTTRDAFAGSPQWSRDGKSLVYYEAETAEVQKITSPRRLRGVTQIVRVDVTSGERHVLTIGAGEKWSPQVLADGRIGYVSGGPSGGVEFVDGAGGARGEIRNPSWSPDGARMVYQRDVGSGWPPRQSWRSLSPRFALERMGVFPSYAPGGDRLIENDQTAGALHNSILLMDADGGRRSVLFTDSARSALAPVWSPCGDLIAFGIGAFFQTVVGASIADVAVVRADGSALRILTDGTANYGLPSWSPDGRQLVYRLASKEHNGLFIMDVATGSTRSLTSGTAHDNFPSWSSTGESIAFTSDRDGDFDVYTIGTDGTHLRRLTQTPGNDAHNAFSPDGEWIAFTSARGGFKDESPLHPNNPQPYGDLYVMRRDGSDVTQLTDNQYEEGTPAWVTTRASRPRRTGSCR